MPVPHAALAPRSISAGALLALAIGVTFYQLTSLALAGPQARVLHLSLLVPQVQTAGVPDAVIADVKLVGSRVEPAMASLSPLIGNAATTIMQASAAEGAVTMASTTPITLATEIVPLAPCRTVKPSAENSHYHGAGERSPGLARRR